MEITEVVTTTRTFTDLMTGETVQVTGELTPVTLTIGDKSSETLYFSEDSLSALRALATEDGEGFRALFAPVKSANGSTSKRNTNVIDGAYPWERRAFAAKLGLADASKGGVLSTEATEAFHKAVADGSYTVIGTAKPPVTTADVPASDSAENADANESADANAKRTRTTK